MLPAGEPRRLGSLEVLDAGVLPDGRFAFSTGTELFVADKDGSNPHKLVSVEGAIWDPSVSPDGKRIVFRMAASNTNSLLEIATDGTGFGTILKANHDERIGSGAWSSDGRYFVYSAEHGRGSDLWALPMQTGIFDRSKERIRLTNGPLYYSSARTSREGKKIFAIGTKRRGELVRYDVKSLQFVPFLSGISATSPSFSKDGQWVAYTSYPDHTLWRSRSDGSERMQLTYPPTEVIWPSVSPDGTKVTFTVCCYETHVIDMDGGLPQRIEKQSSATHFSPDQNSLIITSLIDGGRPGDKNTLELKICDLRTGKISVVPSSAGKLGGQWITQDKIVAVTEVAAKLMTFDFKTEEWTDLVVGDLVNWAVSPDGKYLTFTTGGAEPKVQRLRFADRQIETIASLKDLRRVVDSVEISGTQVTVAPDGSPVFTRDVGTQEIYSLTVKWP
jgi:Tol biopolymer transport system component